MSEVKNKGKTFKKSDSTNVYMHKGCEYRVKREFEESGVTILDQVISVLLDIENETNQVEKNKKRYDNKDCYVFENRYEPLIDKETWEIANDIRKSTRSSKILMAENPFKGVNRLCRLRKKKLRSQRKGVKILIIRFPNYSSKILHNVYLQSRIKYYLKDINGNAQCLILNL